MTEFRVNFVDFHESFSPAGNHLLNSLLPHFNLRLSEEPDYLFYSVFGFKHAQPRFDHCVKIWCTEENFRPNFTRCDYALTFDHLNDNPRHLRLPLYVRYLYHHEQETGKGLMKPTTDGSSAVQPKTRFCNFIYSNPFSKHRIDLFHLLSRYKRVDSAGLVLNNLGYRVKDKLAFIAPYKFTIAFENSSHPGYLTEKLVEPMLANSLPIYWGDPCVRQDFNEHSFINCHNHPNLESVVQEVMRLDQDDKAYADIMKEPWLIGNQPSRCCQPDYLVPFFTRVFSTPPHPTARWAGIKPIDYAKEPRIFM